VHFRIAAVARRNIMVDTQKSCQLAGIACDHLTWPRFGRLPPLQNRPPLRRAADWSLRGEAVLGSPPTFWSNIGLPAAPIVGGVSAGSVEFACSNPFGSSRIR
jgi:hypothetical protein